MVHLNKKKTPSALEGEGEKYQKTIENDPKVIEKQNLSKFRLSKLCLMILIFFYVPPLSLITGLFSSLSMK